MHLLPLVLVAGFGCLLMDDRVYSASTSNDGASSYWSGDVFGPTPSLAGQTSSGALSAINQPLSYGNPANSQTSSAPAPETAPVPASLNLGHIVGQYPLNGNFVLKADDVIWLRRGDGKLAAVCPRPACGEPVYTGSTSANVGPLRGHMNGKGCRKRLEAAARACLVPPSSEYTHQSVSISSAPGSVSHVYDTPNITGTVVSTTTAVHGHAGPALPITPSRRAVPGHVTPEIVQTPPTPPPEPTHRGRLSSRRALFLDETEEDNMHASPSPSPTPTPRTPRPLPSPGCCPGILLEWPSGDFFRQYPWHRHGFSPNELGYKFCGVEESGEQFYVRSNDCLRRALVDGGPCPRCDDIRADVARLSVMAQHAQPHTRYEFRSYEQLRELLKDRDRTLNTFKLKCLNIGRKVASVMQRLTDYRRFVSLVASSDIPGLRRVVAQAQRSGASITAIIRKVEAALEYTYGAKGFSGTDLDLALLCLRLGGRRLLYAMQKHFGLPSLRQALRACTVSKFAPSLAYPTYEEATFNAAQITSRAPFNTEPANIPKTGGSILWDEISIEGRADYMHHLDAVGGIAREDADKIDLRLSSFESAEAIARALENGTVHFGKEASVIAAASFAPHVRNATPLIVSPTNKTETPEGSETILRTVLAAWKKTAEEIVGPIWCFSSDGDAGRRRMVHNMFMCTPISSTHPLWKHLGHLPGLNLYVGEDDVTGDFDWKHLLKRCARLLRSFLGFAIDTTVIKHETLRYHLGRLGLSTLTVDRLLKPEDGQDVPRAMELLEHLADLRTLEPEANPSRRQEANILTLVGEMYGSYLDAFVTPAWSLSQQLEVLSKCAHMAFALYRIGGSSFMPTQLYYDIQSSIKNIFFCVAKQKELDPAQPFYIMLTGDDRLELLFGRVRMQGGHTPNFSFKQLVDRLRAAVDLDAIFARHPHLDQGHRRRDIRRSEDRDHLNPESWDREQLIVDDVHLATVWRLGRETAEAALAAVGIVNLGIEAIFNTEPGVDLMRPNGDNTYPGVGKDEPDDARLVPEPVPVPVGLPDGTATGDVESVDADVLHVAGDPLNLMDCATDERSADAVLNVEPDFDEELEAAELGEMDDTDEAVLPDSTTPRQTTASAWVEHDGKRIHKSTLCRVVITPDYVRLSHERTLRVRNFSTDFKRRSFKTGDDAVLDPDTFVVGDPFATLVRVGNIVSLALVKSTSIEAHGVRVDAVNSRDLARAAAKISISGQIYDMAVGPSSAVASASGSNSSEGHAQANNADSNDIDDAESPYSWIWTGNFARFESEGTSSTARTTRKTIELSKISGVLCEPVNPRVLNVFESEIHSSTVSTEVRDHLRRLNGVTWEFMDGELGFIIGHLWHRVKDNNLVSHLHRLRASSTFPYRDSSNDIRALSSREGCEELEVAHPADGKHICFFCPGQVQVDAKIMREHVGGHILRAMRGVDEHLRHPIGASPCGFCGRSGLPECQVYLTKASKGKQPQARSNCPYYRTFYYANVSKSRSRCSNVPVLCEIPGCLQTDATGKLHKAIWKYSMPQHIRDEHGPAHGSSGYSPDGIEEGAALPETMACAIYIPAAEEEGLGIPQHLIPVKLSPPRSSSPDTVVGRKRTRRGGENEPAVKRRH
ncbi:unnamed protein product [Peniophora sp. CBMAI 1063]|nr:unnamed protein product [Peniophora sp. CBMAI 1063]